MRQILKSLRTNGNYIFGIVTIYLALVLRLIFFFKGSKTKINWARTLSEYLERAGIRRVGQAESCLKPLESNTFDTSVLYQ